MTFQVSSTALEALLGRERSRTRVPGEESLSWHAVRGLRIVATRGRNRLEATIELDGNAFTMEVDDFEQMLPSGFGKPESIVKDFIEGVAAGRFEVIVGISMFAVRAICIQTPVLDLGIPQGSRNTPHLPERAHETPEQDLPSSTQRTENVDVLTGAVPAASAPHIKESPTAGHLPRPSTDAQALRNS